MKMRRYFNAKSHSLREVVIDLETTGVFAGDGHRMTEIIAVEMDARRPTGREFYARLDDTGENGQPFAGIAGVLRDFIGDAPVIISCRPMADGYVQDTDFLNAELARAGQPPVREDRFVNLRTWADAMFGQKAQGFDKLLERYSIKRRERTELGSGIAQDARLLAELYPKILRDYEAFAAAKKETPPAPQRKPA